MPCAFAWHSGNCFCDVLRSSAAPPPPSPPPAAPTKRADGRVIATPYAKKLAKEMGIDLASIGGSGPNGRITASDVEAAKNGGVPPSDMSVMQFSTRTAFQDDLESCCCVSHIHIAEVLSTSIHNTAKCPICLYGPHILDRSRKAVLSARMMQSQEALLPPGC